jgi:hypothetical protein
MLEVEQASMNSEAQARLAQIRSQLGLSAGAETPADAPADGTPGTAGETPSAGA